MDPSRYITTYRLRIIAIAAVAGIAFLLLGSTFSPQYESTSRVAIGEPDTAQEVDQETREANLLTQASVAHSVDVEQIAAEELGLDRPGGLAAPLEVTAIAETNALRFTYSASDAEVAQERAQAFAEAYLEFRRRVQLGSIIVEASELGDKLEIVESDLERVLARLARAEGSAERKSLQSLAGIFEGAATRIEFELAGLDEDIPSAGAIVQPAGLPIVASSPNDLLNTGLGVMVGLVAGIGYAAWQARWAERALTSDKLEAYLGASVLGAVPRPQRWRRRLPLITERHTPPPISEAYRILRTNILSSAADRPLQTIVVTSVHTDQDKTATSANLALVLAHSKKRVVLVSADLRGHRLSHMFDVAASPGLTNVLADDIALQRALVPTATPGMDILPEGTLNDDPAQLLGSRAMAAILRTLASRYDLVIIDAAPVLGIADTLALAPLADGLLLVVDCRSATPDVVDSARKQIDHVNARTLGAVLTRCGLPSRGRGGLRFRGVTPEDAAA